MNRQLASAVLGTFRTFDPPEHAHRLGRFRQRQWQQTLHWLDASGLALYFLRELRIQGIEHVVPSPILEQLGRRQRDNIERTKSLFEEFAKINAAFRAAGFQYLNLKGFTLAPDYCPDLSLRYQTDCDFLMHESDGVRCQDILEQFGYGIVAANASVFEFKTDVGTTPGIADLYKPRVERSVEVHLCDVSRPDRHPELLIRARELPVDGDAYPALSTGDMFLSQAYHLFRHLRSEWTRISWVLELKHFVARHRDDEALWRTVRTRAGQYRDGALAVELA